MGKIEEIAKLPYEQDEIDLDIRDMVNALNRENIPTVSSCSGHGKEYGHIWLKDNRVLVVLPSGKTKEDVARILNSGNKDWRELDPDQSLPGWQYYIWPKTRRSDKEFGDYQTGKISKEEYHERHSITFKEEFAIYKKAQQDMLGNNWREVKG